MLSRPFAVHAAWTITSIRSITMVWPLTAEIAACLVTRLQHLLSVATPIVELAVTDIGFGKLILDLLVVVTHATPVLCVVLPMLDAHIVPNHGTDEAKILIAIDVYVSLPPIELIPDGSANSVGCSPCESSG